MNNFLAIDTSSRYLEVLGVKGAKAVTRRIDDCALAHSVKLMGEIDEVLKELDLTPRDCDFFAAVTGPGSFTGIRIGISAAKGFATALNKPLVSVTAFDLIAYNVRDDNFFAVIDAAHSHYYVCGYDKQKSATLAPCYLSGEQVEALRGALYGFEDLPLNGYTRVDLRGGLYNAIVNGKRELSQKMQALYVRKSQAEEGRKN